MDAILQDTIILQDTVAAIDALETQRKAFSQLKTDLLSRYLQKEHAQARETMSLLLLNGWGDYSKRFLQSEEGRQLATESISTLINKQPTLSSIGGYFLNLHGVGIVINPGANFLQRFHAASGHIWDIHHVIVTSANIQHSIDLAELYTLNKELNAQLRSYDLAPHVIHYHLHPAIFTSHAAILKPSLRQERGTVNSLELFQDSHGVEEISLSPTITLSYTSQQGQPQAPCAIKIAIEGEQTTFGFYTGGPVTDSIVNLLAACPILLLGIGEVEFEEIAKLHPSKSTVGYTGIQDIVKKAKACQLCLVAEQGMLEGDIRLEIIRQLRMDTFHKPQPTPLLPTEVGIGFDLQSLACSIPGDKAKIPLQNIRVVRSNGQFSRLTFIDSRSIL